MFNQITRHLPGTGAFTGHVRHRFATLGLALLTACASTVMATPNAVAEKDRVPNIILIFTDDQGYGDIGCYGGKGFQTPNLDRMAKEGTRFTDFYVGCPVCSGSRTALMTGCHYQRLGVPAVMFPGNRNGLNPDEITIADMLKSHGYATGCVGKWHLGHLKPFLPTAQGFDSYFGIPYSNDMTIDPKSAQFDDDCVFREGMTKEKALAEKPARNKVPLMRGTKVIEYPTDQRLLTQRYTEETVKFIHDHKSKPFFLYLPHTMPHLPMAVSKEFQGRTKSLFGDVMEEIDWSVGEVLKAIKDAGIDENTLVIFTTDNGTRSGSSGPLRGRKAQVYEGGIRVPCIMRWPGQVPSGSVCSEVAATIDVLPTLAKITGAEAPSDRVLDGKDISDLILGKEGAKSPHKHYILAHGGGAVRSGKWKFYPWPEGKPNKGAKPAEDGKPSVQLYDLTADLGESKNVAEEHPDVVKELSEAYRNHQADLKKNSRPVGRIAE